MSASLETLLVKMTKAEIYDFALGIAEALGLPVTTWHPGDPTRSLYHVEAEFLAAKETLALGYIESGFLDSAKGVWLRVIAEQFFGVTVPEATRATTTVTLSNSGGGLYTATEHLAIGTVTFKNSTTGKTYRNTSTGTLASGPGTTLDLTVEADEPGSDSSASAGEIDELVTGLLGVTVTNATAAIGTDDPTDATVRQLCRDARGALSPNGPKEAYRHVALNSAKTGTTAITDARVYSDSDACEVTVYLRSASGAVLEADRALVEAALIKWALPLCITLFCLSATPVVVPVTYSLSVYKSCNLTAAQIADLVESALEDLIADLEIGGNTLTVGGQGYLHKSLIERTILGVLPQAFNVSVTLPTASVALATYEVATLGTVTPTITLVVDP